MSQDRPLIVDLGKYQSRKAKVFVGRDRGTQCRLKVGLDAADRSEQSVEVRIPHDTLSVTPSFFLAMFGDSIRKLGKREFTERYSFIGWDARAVVEDGIREATRGLEALGRG